MDDELICSECSAKLTGEEGMDICLPCQDGDNEQELDGDFKHGSLIVEAK